MGKIICSVDAKIDGENLGITLDLAKDDKLGLCIGDDWMSEEACAKLTERVEQYCDVRVILDVDDARQLAYGLMSWVNKKEAESK